MRNQRRKPTVLLLAACASFAAIVLTGCADRAATGQVSALESAPAAPASIRFAGRDPGVARSRSGGLHVAYVQEDDDGRPRVVYRFIGRDGEGPSPAVRVSPPELDVSAHGEVPPVVVELASSLAVAYTVRLPGKWKGEIRLQRSLDGGASWTPPALLHDDVGHVGGHGFVSAVRSGDEAVFAWLDNRDGDQGLRSTRLDDDGALAANRTVDGVTCQCCATTLLAGDSALWLAYRDLDDASVRDIALARSDDGGASFTRLGVVSDDAWRLQGCPHTGPRLARAGDGPLWAIWFSGREPGIYAASSVDGGATFRPRRVIARPGEGGLEAVAHPEIVGLGDGRLVAVYEATRRGARTIEARLADAGAGAWSPPLVLAAEGVYPRSAGGDRPVLTYTMGVGADAWVVVADLATLIGEALSRRASVS